MDLFDHKVGIAVFLCSRQLPVDMLRLLMHFISLAVIEMHGIRRHFQQISIVEINYLTGVPQYRRNVRGHKVAAVSHSNDHGAGLLCRNDGIRLILTNRHKGIAALDHIQCHLHGIQQLSGLLITIGNQITGNLRVRLRQEGISLLQQHRLEIQIVLHNTVMDQRNFPITADMRMGIEIRGCAVGRPSGMSDANISGQLLSIIAGFYQIGKSSLLFHQVQLSTVKGANTRRIISSVFQLRKAIQQHRCRRNMTCKSNNTTHKQTPFWDEHRPLHISNSIIKIDVDTISYDYTRNFVENQPIFLCEFS